MGIRVTSEFIGYSDYWGGNGRRWDDNAGCLFATYDHATTLRDIVAQWVNDFSTGGDCDSFPESVTSDDIRQAILDALTSKGRADYDSGALAECAADCEDSRVCAECGERVGHEHQVGCSACDVDWDCPIDKLRGDYDLTVTSDDDLEWGDCVDLPVWIVLVEVDVCAECGKADDHYVDELCGDCTKKHYPDCFDDCVA